MKTFAKVISESTCLKRVTICEIYDRSGALLSRESNRCNPPGGMCSRIGVVQLRDNYDVNSNCNWTHAEIMAIRALPGNCHPHQAILYGHDFYCFSCEERLRAVGVTVFLKLKTPL